MAVDFKEIVTEFFEKHGVKYPELKLDDYLTICKAPFLFFRKTMEAIDFPKINVKYFGKFLVHPGSARGMMEVIEKQYNKGAISYDEYLKKTVNLKSYINEYEKQHPPSSQGGTAPN